MYPSEKDRAYFFSLLVRYNAGEASPEETEFVERYLHILEHRVSNVLEHFEQEKESIGADIKAQLFSSIREERTPVQPVVHRIHFMRRRGWWAAASVAILLAGGAYWAARKTSSSQPVAIAKVQDLPAGKAGAVLTLSDGTQVVLDSLGNGIIATQNGTQVQLKDQQLVYDRKSSGRADVIAYNTMSTPRGRQFQLTLPDGTKVWLNAASSLTYPTVFPGKERLVKVSGEAYFEVAQQANAPFKVTVDDGTTIDVLGTHFNVNAYSDKGAVSTTLLEGAVKVSAAGKAQLLKPGQQAKVTAITKELSVFSNVNINQIVAWKDGVFAFNNADIATVMQELSRWYDVEVEYEGISAYGDFSGEIDKSLSLSQVLKGLSKTIKYKLSDNGKKIIVLP